MSKKSIKPKDAAFAAIFIVVAALVLNQAGIITLAVFQMPSGDWHAGETKQITMTMDASSMGGTVQSTLTATPEFVVWDATGTKVIDQYLTTRTFSVSSYAAPITYAPSVTVAYTPQIAGTHLAQVTFRNQAGWTIYDSGTLYFTVLAALPTATPAASVTPAPTAAAPTPTAPAFDCSRYAGYCPVGDWQCAQNCNFPQPLPTATPAPNPAQPTANPPAINPTPSATAQQNASTTQLQVYCEAQGKTIPAYAYSAEVCVKPQLTLNSLLPRIDTNNPNTVLILFVAIGGVVALVLFLRRR